MRRRIISKTDNTVLMPPPSYRIKYTTSDNNIIDVSDISENKNIISNTYVEDFGGIIELDGVLTDMYPGLFSNKVTLTGVTLPNTLHYIAFAAFEYCLGLEEVIISNNIINIHKQAFTRCINLKKIHIGRSVERLGYEDGSESLDEYSVFSNCSNIAEITVDPANITYSDGSDSDGANVILDKNTKTVLVGCKNSIIPTSAFIIGYYAFSECNGMVSITIPSNILEIKDKAFYECSDLKTIIFESTTPATIPTGLIHEIFNDRLEKILVPHESVDLYKECWPGYASKIFSNALFINYTTSDGNIITPAKTNAFGDAQIVSNTYSNGIGIIELDKPCTVLKDSAFMDITTLTSFKIPESVTSIEKSIFYNTGIEEIYIPKNVTTLGENVLRNMYSLKKIVVDPRNTVFDSRDNCNAIIKTSTNTLLSCCIETVIPESVKIIGVRAYQGVQVENFTIPNWITKLESYAFGWCDKLKSITIPNSVTSLSGDAFYNCTGLQVANISDLTTWCGIDFDNYYANPLYYAKNLYLNGELVTELVIPNGIKEIKKYAFYNCTGLTSVVIGDGVTSIGKSAFGYCSGLTSITIPNSVTSIGDNAFEYCDGLKTVYNFSNLTFSKGSSSYGYVAYYANKVINAPNGSVEGYYRSEYFTIEALEDGLTAKLSTNACEYRIDDGSWITLSANSNTPSINKGQTLSFRGNLTPTSSNGIGTFTVNKSFNVEGNIMSILYGDDFIGQNDLSGKTYAFYNLFKNCTTIKNAENLILPATTLAIHCYNSMFCGCTSLTEAPELPATTLASFCYYYMFYGCSNLTIAPELPATTLTSYCYEVMFFGCKKLNYIKMLATDISANHCLYNWVDGVSSTGTFVKHPDMTSLPNGGSGIPEGWTVEEYQDSGNDTSKNLITFTISGTEYQAEEGMTWGEWVESEYNTTKEFYMSGINISCNIYLTIYKVKYDSSRSVFITDIITNNYNYILGQGSGGSDN